MADELNVLRESIAEVDRGLLELLHRRMELSAQVGRVKAAAGMEVVARDVEDRVLGRARERAESRGISEEAMESIFREILRASVERQHRVGIEERVRRGGRVLVIGGAGGMGSWLRRFLAAGRAPRGCRRSRLGRSPAEEGRWAALEAVPSLEPYDAVVLSVPLAPDPRSLTA